MAASSVPDEAWEYARAIYVTKGAKGARELLLKLGHDITRSAITAHMQRANVVMDEESRGHWTKEDRDLLRKVGPNHSARYLQQQHFPERTWEAIRSEAARLNISLNVARQSQGGRTEPMLRIGPWGEGETRVAFLGDQQVPEIDWTAHRVVCHFLASYIAPHRGQRVVFLMGDGLNATTLGRFDHDPDTPDMDEEIRGYRRVLEDYRAAAGDGVQWVVIEGNHEYRLWKFIQREPRMKTLIRPWPELLELDRIFGAGNWHWVPYMAGFVEMPGPFLVHHGYRVSQNSAYAAKLHVENTGVSMIHGHTHRLGAFYKTYYDRTVRGYENGSLCVPQSYVPGVAAWQLGFSYGRWWGERYVINQVEIIEGAANVEGEWFRA